MVENIFYFFRSRDALQCVSTEVRLYRSACVFTDTHVRVYLQLVTD